MNLYIDDFLKYIDGEIIHKGKNIKLNNCATDTREVGENDVFFAIKGKRFNANEAVLEVFKSGAAICIVDEIKVDIDKIPSDKTLVLVDNVTLALGKIAKKYRETLNLKIVGVTGSVGKTSSRDMITAVLSNKYKVFKTKGNYNSEIGLPLMILSIDDSYDVAVLEMGMDKKGDIEYLVDIANPDIAVITNIGVSHIESLGSRDNIYEAKMEITSKFNDNNILIVNGEDDYLGKISEKSFKVVKTGKDIKYSNVVLDSNSSQFDVTYNNTLTKVNLNIPGKHNIINSLLAITVGIELDVDMKNVSNILNKTDKTSMRLDFMKLDDITIINDCYNASPDSMKAAIDVLSNINRGRRLAVLGTMKELGPNSKSYHREVAEHIAKNNIDKVYVYGEYMNEFKDVLNDYCEYFEDKNELISALKKEIKSEDTVLVKASRSMHFEDIISAIIN